MKKIIKELTKAEEQVMQILWKLEKAFVKDIVEQFEEPKPAYNTVSTIIRILEKKEFVSYKSYGNTYEYFPFISKLISQLGLESNLVPIDSWSDFSSFKLIINFIDC